jgi:hypothetical protein
LDKILKFAKDDYLGYTTLFTDHLEVLNASVRIRLPSYDGYREVMSSKYILDKYSLIIEEHSEIKELRNAVKLGTS